MLQEDFQWVWRKLLWHGPSRSGEETGHGWMSARIKKIPHHHTHYSLSECLGFWSAKFWNRFWFWGDAVWSFILLQVNAVPYCAWSMIAMMFYDKEEISLGLAVKNIKAYWTQISVIVTLHDCLSTTPMTGDSLQLKFIMERFSVFYSLQTKN